MPVMDSQPLAIPGASMIDDSGLESTASQISGGSGNTMGAKEERSSATKSLAEQMASQREEADRRFTHKDHLCINKCHLIRTQT